MSCYGIAHLIMASAASETDLHGHHIQHTVPDVYKKICKTIYLKVVLQFYKVLYSLQLLFTTNVIEFSDC